MTDTTAIALLSGGLDSATAAALAKAAGCRVIGLSFDYGQRHRIEMDVRTTVLARLRERFPQWASRLGADHVLKVDVLAQVSESSLTQDMAEAASSGERPAADELGHSL